MIYSTKTRGNLPESTTAIEIDRSLFLYTHARRIALNATELCAFLFLEVTRTVEVDGLLLLITGNGKVFHFYLVGQTELTQRINRWSQKNYNNFLPNNYGIPGVCHEPLTQKLVHLPELGARISLAFYRSKKVKSFSEQDREDISAFTIPVARGVKDAFIEKLARIYKWKGRQ